MIFIKQMKYQANSARIDCSLAFQSLVLLGWMFILPSLTCFEPLKIVVNLTASYMYFTLQIVYLYPLISTNSYIQMGKFFLNIVVKVYLVKELGSLLRTRVTSLLMFSLIWFLITRKTSKFNPSPSFWGVLDRLKYVKEADISSENLRIIDAFPL